MSRTLYRMNTLTALKKTRRHLSMPIILTPEGNCIVGMSENFFLKWLLSFCPGIIVHFKKKCQAIRTDTAMKLFH